MHLIDFGVARFFDDQSVTYTGQLVGTPLYMSPEQVTGRGAIDARTDIYSLGLVLYELLDAAAADRGDQPREPAADDRHQAAAAGVVAEWRGARATWSGSSTRRRKRTPTSATPSAGELAADLDRFLAGKPVAAPPYHFRLDEREITAARPSQVVLAAVDLLRDGVFLFLAFTSLHGS